MATRVFGPVRGAGVQINELEGDKPIEPGALGWVGWAMLLEKGPTDEMIMLNSPDVARRKVGAYISDGYGPDCIYHYFDIAAGAGGILAKRVTDGNEVQAQLNLYARRSAVRTPIGNLKAHNGGRWGGKLKRYTADLSNISKLADTTLDTEDIASFMTDEYAGGYIQLSGVGSTQYPIIGNTAAGVFTVASDQTMLVDLTAGTPADLRYYLVRANEGKMLSAEIRNGEENPDTEFGIFIYVDGILSNAKWPNLSMDPTSARYWVNIVNNDTANYEVVAEDTWTGAITADIRPADIYGKSASGGVATTALTCEISDFTINSPGGGDPTFALGTTVDEMVAQRITVTMIDATSGNAVSDKFGALGVVTLATLFSPPTAAGGALQNKWAPPFTVTAGGSPLAATDTLIINYKPFVADALINGYLYPDQTNAADKRANFRIVDNTHAIITVADGNDLTAVATALDDFMVRVPMEFEGGRDGNADIADTDYIQAWDVDGSVFNRIVDRNMGLVKFATPGVTATAVEKAGKNYANAKNHKYRLNIPANITTDDSADEHVNDTIGRDNYLSAIFPGWAYVADPEGNNEGRLKLVPTVGMVAGREARMAVDNDGYHKAEAGLEAILPHILKLPTGERPLDEELLNPRGIAVIKKKKGNFIIWGDRNPAVDAAWRWKHQRETMSYYEHVLQENFDWIIFQLNNPATQQRAYASLRAYFLPEYAKGALRGDDFDDAITIKLDDEINTPLTEEAGDMLAMILLNITGTVERFKILIGKQGIFESTG